MLYRNALALCLMFLSLPAFAQDNQYLQELYQQVREMHLAERVEWRNLLHYKPYSFLPGSRSLADDPSFFNAKDGKTNAESELEATLKAFFSTIEETDKQQNPQCRFVARYHWLDSHLHFDSQRLKVQECRRFNNWRKALNPHEVTLVFPSAHINSPGSMYGHTLLRIDAKDQDEHTRLLAYTIGYTAATNETNGLLFAYLGLTGGYQGIFEIMPYYLKVSEYTDMENRDIWEFRLNLNHEEIDRMMMHVWELRTTYFDYYFLDENCAYHLLSLLEVARPSLKLTDEFRWWAIPTDTVHTVAEQPELMENIVYRPSNATIVTHRLLSMQPEQRTLALAVSNGLLKPDDEKIRALPLKQQAEVAELGLDYLTYLQSSQGEVAARTSLSRKLLLARSMMDTSSVMPAIKTPVVRPDQGHKSMRVSVGGGNRDGVAYQELAVRPAYHDLNDPGAGYISGAQIQFFNFAVRHYGAGIGTRIEEFVPIDIFSLSPRNDFFQSLSWKVNVGWARKHMADGSEPLVARLNAGAGYAWDAPSLDQPAAQTYAFMDATLEHSGQYARDYAFGMGPAVGVITDVSSNWRLNAYARVLRFALGEPHTAAEITLLQRYSIGPQTALRLEIARKMEFDMSWTDARLSLQQYF